MDCINKNSCDVTLPSSASGQPPSDTSSGTIMGKNVIVRDKSEFSLLLDLPPGIQSRIFTYLRAHDITQLTRANSQTNNGLKNDAAMAKAWYRHFASSHQTLLKTIVAAKDKDELQKWLKRFTKDEALVKSIMDHQASIHFPVLLYFTLTKLMTQCKTFALETKATLPCDGETGSATFSADGRHLVSVNCKTVEIYGQKSDGSWEAKGTICHDNRVCTVTFSANGRYVVTAADDFKTKIYGQKDEQSWEEKATISHDNWINSATFSADSRHLVSWSKDGKAKIYGKNDEGSWEKKATIYHDEWVCSATFSVDSCYVVTADGDGKAKIYGKTDEGSWEEKAIISHNKWVKSATFSTDGRYVVTASGDGTAKIYGQGEDGLWTEKAVITHDMLVASATFSTDGR
ncbi:WD40 repeat domain-containing protein, partial [Endozoicomonas sp. ALB122]